jgi:hypothetical protein
VYGDSMTAGFPCYEPYAKSMVSTLAATGIYAEVVGCGLCGLTAVEMARGLDSPQLQDQFGRMGPGLRHLLEEQGPFDLVIVMAGTNDLGVPHATAEEVLASLQSMHGACWATGTPSVALSVPESSVTGTTQYPEAAVKWHAINNGLAAWAQAEQRENSHTRPFFVNTARLVSFDHAARARGLWDPDSLHFTAAGSQEFGSKLAPVIAPCLQRQVPKPKIDGFASNASTPRPLTPNAIETRDQAAAMDIHRPLTPRLLESNTSTPRQLTPRALAVSDRAAAMDIQRPLTPEKRPLTPENHAIWRTDCATSADWSLGCGMQNLRKMPMTISGVSPVPSGAAVICHGMYRPLQLRVGVVH